MIATVFSKTLTVTAFSKNARFFTFRPSPPSTTKFNCFFNHLPKTSLLVSQRRMVSLLAAENEELVDADRIWDLVGLRKEVSRSAVRCHKKAGKANERLRKAQEEVDRLTSDESVTMEELENCPNLDEIEGQVEALRSRLQQLNKLEVMLTDIKGKKMVLPEQIRKLAIILEVDDKPPQRQPRGRKKKKGSKNMTAFRLPYRRFYTGNRTEIRVGKQAEDNDELSINSEHRDGADWWMHASGCPGSHVIIRCHDQKLNEDVVMDAAALAARQSKCNGNIIKVSMTRARDVKKPLGAKAGLVELTGQVRTVTVNMKEVQVRLCRLDETMLIN
eukprot:CAMPEP_0197177046 /NCGR_PEP_ID=MMETSP1423-20130617/2786_1 /TAXON_ID=476441 /ORGANISM="Pseudo-nitzschia heimii, Strain UNC1101" /LENGTH=330 /DNA_ID=CAMNT_0042626527 /DNA_START=182 /DNA_END=1174 /DNA_ORIENTATION=-